MTTKELDHFKTIAGDFKGKRILVYGTGVNARTVIENSKAFQIVGILDRNRKDGLFEGIPVYPFSKEILMKADFVLIASSISAEKEIYDRINEVCKSACIPVYGLYTGNLSKTYDDGLWGYNEDEMLSEHMLKEEIEKHEIISFDLFDTLIMRKTLMPTDVFDIIQYRASKMGVRLLDFKTARIQAEFNLASVSPSLNAIYEELQYLTGIDRETAAVLKNLEITVEEEVITPRSQIISCLHYARSIGKKVYIISNMYFSVDIIKRFTSKLFEGEIDGFYVSNEYGVSKQNGLYECFLRETEGKSYLHIGDNKLADGLFARRNGIDAFVIRSALDMLKQSEARDIMRYTGNVNDNSMAGIFISHCYNNPFSLDINKRFRIQDVEDFAYLFLGGLFSSYIIWLIHQVKNNRFEGVLFAARDGYLLKKMYDNAVTRLKMDCPRSIYFHTSRRSAIAASCFSEEDVVFAAKFLGITPQQLAERIFEIEAGSDRDLISRIISESAKNYRNYEVYLKSNGIKPEKEYVFIDLIASGLTQAYLCKKLLPHLSSRSFCHVIRKYNKMILAGRSFSWETDYDQNKYFSDAWQIVFFESLISAPEETVDGFTAIGQPVFRSKERRTNEQLERMMKAQARIMDYFNIFLSMYDGEEYDSHAIAKRLYMCMDSSVCSNAMQVIGDFTLTDDVGTDSLVLKDQLGYKSSWI